MTRQVSDVYGDFYKDYPFLKAFEKKGEPNRVIKKYQLTLTEVGKTSTLLRTGTVTTEVYRYDGYDGEGNRIGVIVDDARDGKIAGAQDQTVADDVVEAAKARRRT